MQNVICAIRNCGYCSENGFCLNRVVRIDEQGMCSWLRKQGWNQQIEKKYKSSYNPWNDYFMRAPVQAPAQISLKEEQNQDESRKDGPPRD